MANRNFNRKQALEKEVKEVFAKLTFGAAGAVTLTTGHGVASAAKSNDGDYRITLQDKYVSLKFVEGIFMSSTGQDMHLQLKAEDVDGAKTIDLFTLVDATPTNPSNGVVLLLKFELKNTTVV